MYRQLPAWIRTEERFGERTFGDFVDAYLIEVHLLRMGTEGDFRVAEEIFSDLRLSCLFHVRFVSIDAAARFVEFDDRDGFVGACAVAVESAGHVTVQTLGAEHYQYID